MYRIEKRHSLAIRWFHWINFPVLMVMIWSGLLIYWADSVMRIGFGGHTVLNLFPEAFFHPGQVTKTMNDVDTVVRPGIYSLDHKLALGMAYHFFFMWLFFINGLLYVLYTFISGEWRLLLPNRKSFSEAVQVVLHDLHIRKSPLPHRKFNGAQQIAYTSIIVMGAGSLITGLGIYKPTQFAIIDNALGGYATLRFIHFWLTMGYVAFFLVHVGQVARAGWNNFRAMITGSELVRVDGAAEEAS